MAEFRVVALAKEVGINVGGVAEIERTGSLPADRLVKAIAQAFGMGGDELLLAAGFIPEWVERLLKQQPGLATAALRQLAGAPSGSPGEPTSPQQTPPIVIETPNGRLHQGDCIALMQTLDDGSADLVFADPPFNLNKNYGEGVRDDLAETHYFEWSCAWLTEAARVLQARRIALSVQHSEVGHAPGELAVQSARVSALDQRGHQVLPADHGPPLSVPLCSPVLHQRHPPHDVRPFHGCRSRRAGTVAARSGTTAATRTG